MSVLERCGGCGEHRLLFEPEQRCIDCRHDGDGQLVFNLECGGPQVEDPAPTDLKKNPPAGAPRLLRTLVAAGLDPDALETAAALVAALDEGLGAERLDREVAA